MTMTRRHALGLAAGSLAGLAGSVGFSALAQTKYPRGPIRLIIPTPAGGGMDVLARLFGQHLEPHYGQSVVVESKPGANTAIAASYVAGSAPDGQTLLLTYSGVQLNTILQAKPIYQMRDLAPIVMTLLSPVGLAVNAKVPAHNMREFVAMVKQQPRTFSFGSYGAGSVAHFMGEALNLSEGLDMTHVPYKGGAPVLMDLIGGQIPAAFADAGQMAREEQATAKVRMLGVNGARMKSYPNVPTFAEQGFPQLDLPAWHGLFAPAGTPRAIVDDLASVMAGIIQKPEVSARILDLGFVPSGLTGDAFTQYIDKAGNEIAQLFKSGRIRIE